MKFYYGLYAEALLEDEIEADSEEEAMEKVKRAFLEDLIGNGEEALTRLEVVIKDNENDSIFDYIDE